MLSNILQPFTSRFSRSFQIYVLAVLITLVIANLAADSWNPGDIRVYLEAANKLRQGQNPFIFPLPGEITAFQYLPWSLWLFVPLAYLPFSLAWRIYLSINMLILAFSCYALVHIHGDNEEHLLFSYTTAVILSLLLLGSGQATGFVLLSAVLLLLAFRFCLPGLMVFAFPYLVFKPQLVLLFAPAAFLRMGKKARLYSLIGLSAVTVVSFIQRPGWPLELADVLHQIWALDDKNAHLFQPAILSRLLGISYGLPSLLISACLMLASIYLLYRLRRLPDISWLSLALGLSLVSAPYFYSYDLPLLLPLIAWNEKEYPRLRLPFWGIAIAILVYGLYSSSAAIIPLLVVGIQLFFIYFQRESRNESLEYISDEQ